MPKKTISKFSSFVIAAAACAVTFSACTPGFKGKGPIDIGNDGKSDDYGAARVVGEIESKEINESSGVAASRCQPGVFWTHNDSGDGPYIYAFDEKGRTLGTWRVSGAENVDWEDIAATSDCRLYIGEIGNNELKRSRMIVYRINEPRLNGSESASSRTAPLETEQAFPIAFSYADGPHDAEALMVHPKSGDIYVLSKSRKDASGVYRIPHDAKGETSAVRIGEISLPAIPDGLVTGGDISPDGKRVILCDYFLAYELKLADESRGFDSIWKSRPLAIDLPERKIGEAIGYSADGRAIYATSEKLSSPVIRVDRR